MDDDFDRWFTFGFGALVAGVGLVLAGLGLYGGVALTHTSGRRLDMVPAEGIWLYVWVALVTVLFVGIGGTIMWNALRR